jgi:hypothetical protein
LILGEEYRLREFENRMLNKIFGQKMDEVTGGRRKVHDEGRQNFYSSPSVIRLNKLMRIRCRRIRTRVGYCWKAKKEINH